MSSLKLNTNKAGYERFLTSIGSSPPPTYKRSVPKATPRTMQSILDHYYQDIMEHRSQKALVNFLAEINYPSPTPSIYSIKELEVNGDLLEIILDECDPELRSEPTEDTENGLSGHGVQFIGHEAGETTVTTTPDRKPGSSWEKAIASALSDAINYIHLDEAALNQASSQKPRIRRDPSRPQR